MYRCGLRNDSSFVTVVIAQIFKPSGSTTSILSVSSIGWDHKGTGTTYDYGYIPSTWHGSTTSVAGTVYDCTDCSIYLVLSDGSKQFITSASCPEDTRYKTIPPVSIDPTLRVKGLYVYSKSTGKKNDGHQVVVTMYGIPARWIDT